MTERQERAREAFEKWAKQIIAENPLWLHYRDQKTAFAFEAFMAGAAFAEAEEPTPPTQEHFSRARSTVDAELHNLIGDKFAYLYDRCVALVALTMAERAEEPKAEPPAKWCCKGVQTTDPREDQHEPHCVYHSSNFKRAAVSPAPATQRYEDVIPPQLRSIEARREADKAIDHILGAPATQTEKEK